MAKRRRLTDEDVRTIRWTAAAMPGDDMQAKSEAIAKQYGVAGTTIADVIHGHSFAFVTGLPLSVRRWQTPSHSGMLAWMIWLIVLTQFRLTAPSTNSAVVQEDYRGSR